MDNETVYLIFELAVNNSQKALQLLFEKYSPSVARYASLFSKEEGDMDEILSDCFLAVWNNRKKLLQVENFRSYLLGVAKYKTIDRLRKHKMNVLNWDETDIDLFADTVTTPEDDCIFGETVRVLNMAVESLPPKCKMAFKLVREDRMSHAEAAGFMNISVKTLQAHLGLAMNKIRSYLKKSIG